MSEQEQVRVEEQFASLTEGLSPKDYFLRCWLSQVILRTRRELAWLWREQRMMDRLANALEKHSVAEQRRTFIEENDTARYLQEKLAMVKMPLRGRGSSRGSLAWLARELHLSRAEIFAVAFALAAAREADFGILLAALHGETRKQLPTLALAQLLWDEPHAFQALLSPTHPLFTHGILRRGDAVSDWDAPIQMPTLVSQLLEGKLSHALIGVEKVADANSEIDTEVDNVNLDLLANRMLQPIRALHAIPVAGPFPRGTLEARRVRPTMHAVARRTERPIYTMKPNVPVTVNTLENAGIFCWFNGGDLLLPTQAAAENAQWQKLLCTLPIYVFVPEIEEREAGFVPRLPVLRVPGLCYSDRLSRWKHELHKQQMEADDDLIRECAFRFRFDESQIEQVVLTLNKSEEKLTLNRMLSACQQEVSLHIGDLAQQITPRFIRSDLVLEKESSDHFDELLNAMRVVSRVHAEWGTGSAWDDAGVAALFAGPPGTGKTMAAEVIATSLNLPLYRVDLSQVVNKYIGETEKNLRKLFDAAEMADILLFFDEAEVLMGQRMTARQANDRFSNMEVAYLLQRMERFRGLAVLATNRKKDIDEAFLRRLRFSLEFQQPGEAERKKIWDLAIPPQVYRDHLDLNFLAKQFALTGGNIRSIVFNASLQAATANKQPILSMKILIAAIDREYEKLGRPLLREQKKQWQDDALSGEEQRWPEMRGVS